MKLQYLITIIAIAFTAASYAQDKKSKVIALFDGKSLNGWKSVGGNGQYKVEDGCIVGFGTNVKGNTFLRTEKTYGDFELTYEFKFDDRQLIVCYVWRFSEPKIITRDCLRLFDGLTLYS